MNTWGRLPGVLACLYAPLAMGLGSIAFAQVPLNLPSGATTPIVSSATNQSLPSFSQVQFTDLPAGYDVANQTYLGWCTAFNEVLLVSQTSSGSPIWSENNAVYLMFNTYPDSGADSTIPSGDQSTAWPMVDWLLNNKQGASGTVAATVVDIQEAIWFLLRGQYFGGSLFTGSFDPNNPTAAAVQLVSDAQVNGQSFVPAPGQVVAVLLDGVSQPGNSGPPQDLVFEVKAPAVATWLMFHHDPSHTGQSQADTSANKGKQKWTFASSGTVQSSPAAGPDGTIYFGSNDNNLYAVTPDGKQKWKFATGGAVTSSPALGTDGTIYFGSWDKNLYAVTPDGKLKWKFATGDLVLSSPAVGGDGTIYVGSNDRNLYAVTPDGKQKWKFATGSAVVSSPAVGGSDGNIYVGSNDKNLYAVTPDGEQKWKFATGDAVTSSPALGTDGTIYFCSSDKNLYAVNPNGTQKWKFGTGSADLSSPALGTDGTIYFGSFDTNLYAVTPDGKQKWKFGTGGLVGTPALGADGTIYVGAGGLGLIAVTPTGQKKWILGIDNLGLSSPAIGGTETNGTIYIGGGTSKNLIAVQ
jgi:outer membrane protein assembly factor BamB